MRDGGPAYAGYAAAAGFRYLDRGGRPLHDPAELQRIRAPAISPAWTGVAAWRGSSGSARNCRGYELFQYVDENGECRHIDFADVNAYLRDIIGQDFTAKDFRTWAGTVLAARGARGRGNRAS